MNLKNYLSAKTRIIYSGFSTLKCTDTAFARVCQCFRHISKIMFLSESIIWWWARARRLDLQKHDKRVALQDLDNCNGCVLEKGSEPQSVVVKLRLGAQCSMLQ